MKQSTQRILLFNMQTQKYLKLANCNLSNVGISKINHFLAFSGEQHHGINIKAQYVITRHLLDF